VNPFKSTPQFNPQNSKVLPDIIINTGLSPTARLRLNQFQIAIEGMLNNTQISRTKWQVEKLFGTRI
jgi:hypothetical protein